MESLRHDARASDPARHACCPRFIAARLPVNVIYRPPSCILDRGASRRFQVLKGVEAWRGGPG